MVTITECQRLDWNFHKRICPSFTESKPTITDPDEHLDGVYEFMPSLGKVDYKRGLLFPGGDQPPRFVWLKTWITYPGYETWDKTEYFGEHAPECTYEAHSNIQARDICRDQEEHLFIHHKENTAGESPNLAAKACTRSGNCSYAMKGPIMFMYGWVDRNANTWYDDMDMRDARSAADYFSSAYRQGLKDTNLEKQHFWATFILSREDATRHNMSGKYRDSIKNGCDSIYSAEGSGIANLLGIPILIRPMQPQIQTNLLGFRIRDNEAELAQQTPERENRDAMLLLRDITSTTIGPQGTTAAMCPFRSNDRDYAGENGFGSSPRLWRSMSSALLARADGLPLPPVHVEALVEYIRERVEPRLSRAVSGIAPGGVVPSREDVLKSITKSEFEEYYRNYSAMKAGHDPDWSFYPSPYAMTKSYPEWTNTIMDQIWDEQKAAGVKQESEMERMPGWTDISPRQ